MHLGDEIGPELQNGKETATIKLYQETGKVVVINWDVLEVWDLGMT